jgi:predicted ester cyclase
MEANMLESSPGTLREIAQRHAVQGWGTEPGWRVVWREHCSSNMLWWFCGWAEPIRGLDAAMEFNAALFAGFPDLKQTVLSLIIDGDEAAYRHRLEGHHTGPFIGLAPTGRSVSITGMTWLRFSEGKIVERWYELNHSALNDQLTG